MSFTKKQIREELENVLGEIRGQSPAVNRSIKDEDRLIKAIDTRAIPPKPIKPDKQSTRISPTVIRKR
jgi:hypothetical protein